MTKAELEAYAERHGLRDVDRSRQTKHEMVRLIRRQI